MQKNRIVLTSDPTKSFFLVYKCVNDVSSYGTYYFQDNTFEEKCSSVHLRSGEESFVDQMTRRLHPLYDSSSHLSFPTTSLNNVTTKGWDVDPVYFGSIQTAYLGLAFDRIGHVQTPFSTNNRNYTALIHGVENRRVCLSAMEKMDSLKFSRNCSFPPLTWSVTFDNGQDRDVVCRSQIYDNSFALNTQRQTDESLIETSKCILSHLMKSASVDFSVNHLCIEWELKLGRNLSCPEKCQLLLILEVARQKHLEAHGFQLECGSFLLKEYDDTFAKNMYGIKRPSRNNPEMPDILGHLPIPLRDAVLNRWRNEGRDMEASIPEGDPCVCPLPMDLKEWTAEEVYKTVDCLIFNRCGRGKSKQTSAMK